MEYSFFRARNREREDEKENSIPSLVCVYTEGSHDVTSDEFVWWTSDIRYSLFFFFCVGTCVTRRYGGRSCCRYIIKEPNCNSTVPYRFFFFVAAPPQSRATQFNFSLGAKYYLRSMYIWKQSIENLDYFHARK